jgi:hypothetical protein
MSSIRKFLAVQAVSLAAVLVTAATFAAAYSTAPSFHHPGSFIKPMDAALLVFLYTTLIGAPVALLLGAPFYLFLSQRGLASWPVVMALSAAPGLMLLPFEFEPGVFSLVCGLSVAAITHTACGKLALTTRSRPTPSARP